MSDPKKPSKEQLLKTIEQLEKNPGDRGSILAEAGIAAVGVAGAGALAAVFGAGTASIPLVTALTGIGLTVAAPITLVAGAAVAGGAAAYGLSQWIKGSSYNEGKQTEILRNLQNRLKEAEAQERQSNLNNDDKTEFYTFLKELLQSDLISSEDAQQLLSVVENGQMSLQEAYKWLKDIREEAGQQSGVVELYQDEEEIFARGVEKYENEQIDEALQDFQEVLRINPHHANAYFFIGCICVDTEDYPAAIESYTKAIELEPNHDAAYASRGHVYALQEEYENAIVDYTQSLKIDPSDADIYCNRGRVYLAVSDVPSALADFTNAINLDENFTPAYFFRGQIHDEQENYESAIIEYTKAIQLDSSIPRIYVCRAQSYASVEDYLKAIADFNQVIQLDPQYVDAYFLRGCIYLGLENYNGAIADFTQTIEIQSDCETAYLYRGAAYVALKNNEDALSDYDRAIDLDPDYADAYVNRGYLYSAEKDCQRAIENFQKAICLFENQMQLEEVQSLKEEIRKLKLSKSPITSQTDSLLHQAKQGDPDAIASLVNKSLEARGIKVTRSIVKQKCLHFLLETEKSPNQEKLVKIIKSGLLKLNLKNIDGVKIYGCYKGDNIPSWNSEFSLNS